MKELSINYNYSKTKNILFLILGGYISLYGVYQCIALALADSINVNFYFALILIVLGVILLLSITLWAPKPIFILNSISLYVYMIDKKTTYQSDWTNVREVGIGISYLKMLETDGKGYTIDLSALKYSDLKEAKAQVIEICESKNIPYKND